MSNHPENLASVSIGTKSPSPSLSDNYTRGLDAFKGLWDEALANHKSQLGHDLFDSDFAREIQVAVTDQDVTAVVEKQEHLFKKYRERGGRIKSSLKQLVRLLIPFSGAVGDTTTVVSMIVTLTRCTTHSDGTTVPSRCESHRGCRDGSLGGERVCIVLPQNHH